MRAERSGCGEVRDSGGGGGGSGARPRGGSQDPHVTMVRGGDNGGEAYVTSSGWIRVQNMSSLSRGKNLPRKEARVVAVVVCRHGRGSS